MLTSPVVSSSSASPPRATSVVIIGGGPAGYVCAIRLAQLGKQVTLVEKEELGGVCLNRGCIPSKALITASSFYHRLQEREAQVMGIEVPKVTLHLAKLHHWKAGVVSKLTGGIQQLLKAHGCSVISGTARFLDPHHLEIMPAVKAGDKATAFALSFEQAVIATGCVPAVLPGFEVDQESVWDSTGALAWGSQAGQTLPSSLLCIGGGYIGLELGTFYAKLGVTVTIVEAGPELLPGMDPELTQVVHQKCQRLGMTIHLNAQGVSRQTAPQGGSLVSWKIPASAGAGPQPVTQHFDRVLVTIGRVPSSAGLDLHLAGLTPNAKGFLEVSPEKRTTVPHLFAIGDIAGPPLLAHKGSHEGLVAAEVLAGKHVQDDARAMPAVVFTDPEIATVGLTEAQAKTQGLPVKIGRFPFAANGRALSLLEPEGFVKLVSHAETGQLLGAHLVGPEASQLISEAALALEMGAHVEDLALTIHPHPTLSETLMEAAEATLGQAIHLFQPRKR